LLFNHIVKKRILSRVWVTADGVLIGNYHRYYCNRSLEHWNRKFESHSNHGCMSAFILCLCRQRPYDGLLPRPKSPTDCLRIKKLKWNKVFHGCPLLQNRSNRKERDIYTINIINMAAIRNSEVEATLITLKNGHWVVYSALRFIWLVNCNKVRWWPSEMSGVPSDCVDWMKKWSFLRK
jgi:hypothetical protein